MTFNRRDDVGQRSWERTASAEDVAIRRQGEEMAARDRTCYGCEELVHARIFGVTYVACYIDPKMHLPTVEKTRKCDKYKRAGCGK